MRRGWLVAFALLCASVLDVRAQAELAERHVKAAPGRDTRVAVYADVRPDCTSGPLPGIRLVTPPAHGAVTVKRGTLRATNFKHCLATEVPVFVALYRAAEHYNGADEFELEIAFAGGRKEREHFRVTVSDNPGGGQGI